MPRHEASLFVRRVQGLADRCGAAQGNPFGARRQATRPLRRVLGIVLRSPATDGSETMTWLFGNCRWFDRSLN